MVFPHGVGDLYHKYRPQKFEEVVGHSSSIKSIKKALSESSPARSYMLTGASGCGKTTTARIMALAVNCQAPEKGEPCLSCDSCKIVLSGSCPDIIEMNAADTRGIDDIRSLRAGMSQLPMMLSNKVYILDEVQGLTADAQSILLKVLEEAPDHVFIVLCTTDPKKLKSTVKNRCQQFSFPALPQKKIIDLLEQVSAFEGYLVHKKVLEAIAEKSQGLPRNSLVLLQQAYQVGFDDPHAISELLEAGQDENADLRRIASLLLGYKQPIWKDVTAVYKEVKHYGAEAIWMMIAGFARTSLLRETKNIKRAEFFTFVLEMFADGFPVIKPENKLVLNMFKIVSYRVKVR